MQQDISDAIVANQIWFRHFGCSWQSPKVLAWMQQQELVSSHNMDENDLQNLAAQLEGAWHNLSEQHRELLAGVNRLLAKHGFAWDKEPLISWLVSRGLSSREEMSWKDYQDFLQEFSIDFSPP